MQPVAGGGQDHWNDDTIAGRFSVIFDVNEDVELYLMGHGSRIEQGEAPYQSVPSIAIYPDAAAFLAGSPINSVYAGPNELREAIILDGTDPGTLGFGLGEGFSNTVGNTRPCPGCDFFGYRDSDGADFDLSKDFAFEDNMFAETYGVNGKLTWDLPNGVKMVAVSDWKEFDRNITVDVDSGPVDQLQFNSISNLTSFTQELRFEGETDRTRWVGGFYYLYSDAEATNGFIIAPTSVAAPLLAPISPATGGAFDAANVISLETNSFSVFGQVDYDFNDQFTGIFGLRLVQELKDYSMLQGAFALGDDPRTLNTDNLITPLGEFVGDTDPGAYTDDTSETLWSAKWGLNWTPTDATLVYGSLSRGVKAGSFNATLPLFAQVPNANAIFYDQEVLWAYEIGIKQELFDGLARFNASAYYYDYQDYQAARFIGVSTTIENADARMVGVEAEIFASPMDGLDFFFGVHASDPVVKDIDVGGISRDRRPSFAPTLQMSGLIRYAWPAFGGEMAAQADASFKSFMYNNLTNFDATKNGARTTGNLRLSYETADARWRVSAFVENVADARNENLGFDLTAACGCAEVSYERPRWYGVNLRYSYGE